MKISRFDIASKSLLVISICLLAFGTYAAYSHPTTGFELSIYRSTPAEFWASIVLSMSISAILIFSAPSLLVRRISGVMVCGGASLITALPLIRSYFYFGESDAMAQLGWLVDMIKGVADPSTLPYPGIHLIAVILHSVLGISPSRSLLLVIPVFVAIFLIFISLTVREFGNRGISIGLLSATLLLPINIVRLPVLQPVPTSQAVLFVIFPIFIIIRLYFTSNSGYRILFILSSASLVLLHPQHALNLLLWLSVLVIYFLSRGNRSASSTVLLTSILGILLAYWISTRNVFGGATRRLLAGFLTNPSINTQVSDKGDVLQALGGSIVEVFIKEFTLALLFGLLMCIYFIVKLIRLEKGDDQIVLPAIIGLIPVALIGAMYLSAGILNQFFRYTAFVLVVGTVFGSILLRDKFQSCVDDRGALARTVIALFFILCIIWSVPMMYKSPYIYQSSAGIPYSHMVGYQTSFKYQDPTVTYANIRTPIFRYRAAIYGTKSSSQGIDMAPVDNLLTPLDLERNSGLNSKVPFHFGRQRLRTIIPSQIYLVITDADKIEDSELFEGYYYNENDYQYLNNTAGINKIQTNGEFTIYQVKPKR